MSNYLNFSIQTRYQMKDWVLKKLGYPLVAVEITEDQLDISINDALEEFTKYVTQERQYLGLDLANYDEVSGFTLPSNVTSVYALEETNMMGGTQHGFNNLFSVPNVMMNAGMFPIPGSGGTGSWVTYELSLQYMDMIKRLTGAGFEFEYNERTKSLTLMPNPVKTKLSGWICIGCNVIRADDLQFGENWVKRMTLALAKQIIGNVRSKYEGTQFLGGGSVNTSIKREGQQEEDSLRLELTDTYKFVTFYVG